MYLACVYENSVDPKFNHTPKALGPVCHEGPDLLKTDLTGHTGLTDFFEDLMKKTFERSHGRDPIVVSVWQVILSSTGQLEPFYRC
jgi:hypothetical protein